MGAYSNAVSPAAESMNDIKFLKARSNAKKATLVKGWPVFRYVMELRGIYGAAGASAIIRSATRQSS